MSTETCSCGCGARGDYCNRVAHRDARRSRVGIFHPESGHLLLWDDASTWWCFDCLRVAETYTHLDGYVRCQDCTALWAEYHLDVEEWR